jgi:hypothetical protein
MGYTSTIMTYTRPTTRPTQPYTVAQVKAMILDRYRTPTPPCRKAEGQLGPECLYGDSQGVSGCIVGGLLTAEDAKTLDDNAAGTVACMKNTYDVCGDIYKAYFGDSENLFDILGFLQEIHDGTHTRDANLVSFKQIEGYLNAVA